MQTYVVGRKYPVTWRIYGRCAWRTRPYVGCDPCRAVEEIRPREIFGKKNEEDTAGATLLRLEDAPDSVLRLRECLFHKCLWHSRRERSSRRTKISKDIFIFFSLSPSSLFLVNRAKSGRQRDARAINRIALEERESSIPTTKRRDLVRVEIKHSLVHSFCLLCREVKLSSGMEVFRERFFVLLTIEEDGGAW